MSADVTGVAASAASVDGRAVAEAVKAPGGGGESQVLAGGANDAATGPGRAYRTSAAGRVHPGPAGGA